MNFKLALFALVLLSTSAMASIQETWVTCQQADGDQWIESGILLNDGPGFRLVVLKHNADDGSAKIILNKPVKMGNTLTSAVFKSNEAQLIIQTETLKGHLMSLADGAGALNVQNMDCYKNSTINF